jgi:hypothetical protein
VALACSPEVVISSYLKAQRKALSVVRYSKNDIMKTASKVLNVLGILLLTLQVLGHLLRIDAASPDVYGLNAVMYYIGLNLFAIFGLGFLYVSLYLKRKIRRRDYAILADSIGVAGNQD